MGQASHFAHSGRGCGGRGRLAIVLRSGYRGLAMDSFLFTMVTVFLASIGARDQLTVARIASRLGQPWSLLLVAIAVCVVSAVTMAFAGASIAAMLPPQARQMLIAIALVAAAIELFWRVRIVPPREPTQSLGAFGIVLLFRQISDAGRFAVFAFAAATVLAPMAALGGAIGGAAAIYLAWSMGEGIERRLPLRAIRIGLGVVAVCLALYIGLGARGLI